MTAKRKQQNVDHLPKKRSRTSTASEKDKNNEAEGDKSIVNQEPQPDKCYKAHPSEKELKNTKLSQYLVAEIKGGEVYYIQDVRRVL